MTTKQSDKRYLNPVLLAEINSYGRDKLIKKAIVSKGMVDAVCAGRRRFSPDKAKEVASVLKIDKTIVRPDLWA